MEKEKTLEFWPNEFAALIPFLVFIVITVILTFINASDLNMMIGAGLFGLMIGMFFSKDWKGYWETVVEGLGSTSAMTAVLIWLVVGVFGGILKTGHIVEGLVWASNIIGIRGAGFTVFTFIASAIFATSTGTGFGTIATMGFIMYPAGLLLGANPAMVAGAILSGAAFGDNVAPVSDTTIISATSQEYVNRKGVAEVGGVVQTRLKYALVAAGLAIVLFAIFGGASTSVDAAEASKLLSEYIRPAGLLLLIPTAIVIILAVKGVNLFIALTFGIISAILIGLPAKLFTFSELIRIEDGSVLGAVPEGVSGMVTVSILLMIVVAMGQLLIRSRCMSTTVEWLEKNVIKDPRSTELSIWGLGTIFSILIAAINTIAIICAAPFVNAIGKITKLHPYRRANILDAVSCSWPFFVPYGGCVLLLLGTMKSVATTYPFVTPLNPYAVFFTVFYSWILWIVMLVASITGWGRAYEGKDGEIVVDSKNKIPEEVGKLPTMPM